MSPPDPSPTSTDPAVLGYGLSNTTWFGAPGACKAPGAGFWPKKKPAFGQKSVTLVPGIPGIPGYSLYSRIPVFPCIPVRRVFLSERPVGPYISIIRPVGPYQGEFRSIIV